MGSASHCHAAWDCEVSLALFLIDMTQVPDRYRVFRQLHESGCFVIPNPWDLGSARLLVQLGFKALATTSSGFAWSMGRADNHITLDNALDHFRSMAGAVDVPIFEISGEMIHASPDTVRWMPSSRSISE